MKPTLFQEKTQTILKSGKSAILIAPTGLGKTYGVTGDLLNEYKKTIYATPLRALGNDIFESISRYQRNGEPISCVIHHGDSQDSNLFTEEVIVTTYDQVVCAVPGLPLSLPLKAGHAIAGATLLSRLIFDEGHLAWGISRYALSILLGIISHRKKLGLQTVLMTATLPTYVAKRIADEFEMELLIVGDDNLTEDEALELRNKNRDVKISELKINKRKSQQTINDFSILVKKLLAEGIEKKIYFANTVDRLQKIFDLVNEQEHEFKVIVLHNRMPKFWRNEAEKATKKYFGKNSESGKVILLTNQVAEAGLDISAPLVISDPAPVDTLIQRAGRCARWFRDGLVEGEFLVLNSTNNLVEEELSRPYIYKHIKTTLKKIPTNKFCWKNERKWIEDTWMGGKENTLKVIERDLADMTFALNLFDRAAQEKNPGEISSIFREILSVNIAVAQPEHLDFNSNIIDFDTLENPLQIKLDEGKLPETSSISLRRAYALRSKAKGKAFVIRYLDDRFSIIPADYIKPDDLLVIPSTIVYLHKNKGLCFKEADDEVIIDNKTIFGESKWDNIDNKIKIEFSGGAGYQSLLEHTENVMNNTRKLLSHESYREKLKIILKKLEPNKDAEALVDIISQLIYLAAGFHDIGKAGKKWQQKIREIDEQINTNELVGRSHGNKRNGQNKTTLPPHTPPAYSTFIKVAELLLGKSEDYEYLIKAIALAAARHHSSLLNPALASRNYTFDPNLDKTRVFIQNILHKVKAPEYVIGETDKIILAAQEKPEEDEIPLLFPNDDLFPIYVLAGRAILLADREDASGKQQNWI